MTDAVATEPAFQTIKLTLLRESEWNPRKTFAKKPLDELAESVRAKGVLVPLLVRPGRGGTFEIVAGARRYRAARAAGLEHVAVIVRELSDAEALEASVIENAQREDVHPLEEAEGYHALMETAGYDVQTIAARIGYSVSHVYQRLQLAKLIAPAKKAFLEEKITAGHAVAIARLTEKDQERALESLLEEERYGAQFSVRDLQRWIENEIHLDLHGAPWKKDDAELVSSAGPCTTCTKRTGSCPELWPEVKKKDTCTDRACFAAKREAWIARRAAEVESEDGGAPLRLTTDPYVPRGGAKEKDAPIPASNWTRVPEKKKGCDSLRTGIVVDGHAGNVGEVFRVCTDPKCKVHRGVGASKEDGSSYRDEQRARDRKAQRERVARRAILEAILEKVTLLTDDDLYTVAAGLLREMQHEAKKDFLKRHGWPQLESKTGGYKHVDLDASALEAIEPLHGDELARVMLELALCHTLSVSAWNESEPKLLYATAKRYDVDFAEVRKKAAAESKERGKKGKPRDEAEPEDGAGEEPERDDEPEPEKKSKPRRSRRKKAS